jgi:hypothetical protein
MIDPPVSGEVSNSCWSCDEDDNADQLRSGRAVRRTISRNGASAALAGTENRGGGCAKAIRTRWRFWVLPEP